MLGWATYIIPAGRHATTRRSSIACAFYFGGTSTAPHEITAQIREIDIQ